MLSLSPSIGYIHEPFSPIPRPGVSDPVFRQWFTYIHEGNADHFLDSLNHTLNFNFRYRDALNTIHSTKDAVRGTANAIKTLHHKLFRARPLMKDPIALFSLKWLADQFDADVVVIIRHPAAFTNSLISAQWQILYHQLASQKALLEGPLKPFAEEIVAQAKQPGPILDQAILFWLIAHHQILSYQKSAQSGWTFVRHEDLIQNPVSEFKRLYQSLSIPYEARFAEIINGQANRKTNPESRLIPGLSGEYLARDTASLIKKWKKQLPEMDLATIRDKTDPLWREFYTDADW